MNLKRWLLLAAALVFLVFLGKEVFKLVLMGPRDYWGMVRYDQREEGDLAVGEKPPDVVLSALDGATRVHLQDRLGGKPVVLIFGSFT